MFQINLLSGLLLIGKTWFLITVFFPDFGLTNGMLPTAEFLKEALKRAEITPDAYENPATHGIEIWFNKCQVEYGNHIALQDVQQPPTHVNWQADKKSLFVLIMTGLDVPSSEFPRDREWLYWMLGNIFENNITSGEKWAAYVPPEHQYGPGPHRIIFTLYKQPKNRKIDYNGEIYQAPHVGIERLKFTTEEFAERFELGDPYGANFFDLFNNQSWSPLDTIDFDEDHTSHKPKTIA